MGFIKNLVGGSTPKSAPIAAPTDTKAEPTPAETEEERRRRILALNQAGPSGQMTAAGGDTSQATVGRKALLGA